MLIYKYFFIYLIFDSNIFGKIDRPKEGKFS